MPPETTGRGLLLSASNDIAPSLAPAVHAEAPADWAKRRQGMRLDLSVMAAVLLQGMVWGALVHFFKTRRIWYGFFDVSDIGVYENYARLFSEGRHPYAGVNFEYPPLAAPLMSLPKWLPSVVDYASVFATEMALFCMLAAAFATAAGVRLSRGWGRPVATAVAFALITVFAGPIVGNRFDIAVGLDMAVFLYFMARQSWWKAAAALGVGFALKLTPAMFLPLVLIMAATPRRMVAAAAAFALTAVAPFVPHLLRSSRGWLYVFSYHTGRPLQIESLYATPYLVAHVLAGQRVVIGNSHGSQSLIATGAQTLASVSMWLMAASIGALYLLIWRRRRHLRGSPSDVTLAALGLVLAFVCTSKVLSPQFLIWTFPFVALVATAPGASRRVAGVAILGAVLLTQIGFPSRYWDLVALRSTPIFLLAARNLILLATWVMVIVLIWRRPRRAPSSAAPWFPPEP